MLNMEVNAIYEGDNLEILSKFPDKSVDLIYADPPFYTNKGFEIIWKDGAERRAFEDRWAGGIEHFISWMEPRLRECHRILKDTGSMFLHCDWHANAHLRILMDKIFGEKNFKNEIIWKRSDAHNDSNRYGNVHDVILFYTKGIKWTWNVQYNTLSSETADKWYRYEETAEKDIKNRLGVLIKAGSIRRFNKADITGAGTNPNDKPWKEKMPPSGRHWAYNFDTMRQLEKENRLIYSKSGMVYEKRYLDESKGTPLQTVWTDISQLRGIHKSGEWLGFPTQKPVALLERIINCSSNKNEIVLDPFCGCGTTLVASQRLGRKWIGIDISPTACKLMQKRLRQEFKINFQLVRGKVDLNYVKNLQPFEFQNWVVVDKFLGKVSDRKSGDMGIDGWTPQVTGGYPIQVKQSSDVGRNVVDNFETAIDRVNKKKGYIVAFSFGKGAVEEVARIKNRKGIQIILRTVQDLLDGKIEEK